jgi:ABC-type polysaccharide/polyol phosphate transport system ATPase subunit
MMESAISVDGVSKRFRVPLDRSVSLQYRFVHPVRTTLRYRSFSALQDMSFDVPQGQFLGITGPNGCGKSTLLKVLARIYEADEGRVVMRGRVSPFLELGVGFKYELSARENIFLGGAVLGRSRNQIARRVEDVLEFAELTGFADQKLKNFSSGMVLRLAFSVSLLADADILLMDEVLAVGDAHFQEKCFDVFAQYKRAGRTVVLVSHDLNSLELYCDRLLLLQEGKLIADGHPSEVTALYRQIVARMSEVEIEKQPSQGGLSPARRWGTRELEVTDVRLIGADGEHRQSFMAGDRVIVEVDYQVNGAVEDFACSIVFNRSDGASIAAAQTKLSVFEAPNGHQGVQGTISFDVTSIPLLDASYVLTVGLYDVHLKHAYDHLEDVLPFRVSDSLGRPGMVDLGGSWRHRANAAVSPRRLMTG